MKKIIQTLVLLLFGGSCIAQNIPSRGFEDWREDFLPTSFQDWFTSNENFLTNGIDTFNVSPSTDAVAGTYSARLETMLYMGDTIMAYAIAGGRIEGDSLGLVGLGGAPFTAQPDSMFFWAKHQIPAGDSGLVVILFKSGGVQYKEVFSFLTGSQLAWTRYSVPMGAFSQAPDSILVGFTSGNPDHAMPGGWVMIDELSFSGTTQNVPNPGLELLDSAFYSNPVGWTSTNNYSAAFGELQAIQKTTDAHSGQFAMQLEPVYFEAFQGSWGYALTGPTPNSFNGGFDYNRQPTKLSGWYKYSVQSTDTAMIMLVVSHKDTQQDTIINLGGASTLLIPAASYTYFEIPIQYSPSYPVNMANIIVTPSKAMFGGHPDSVKLGSVLKLDDLWLHATCDWTDTTSLFALDTLVGCSPYTVSAGNGFDTYHWSNGSTTSTIDVVTSGTYAVTVTDSASCSLTQEVYVIALICPGIEEEQGPSSVKAFPNPTSGFVQVEQENGLEPLMISILSMEGKLISTQTLEVDGRIWFDLEFLPNGMYMIRAQGKNKQQHQLLVKQ